MKCFPFYANPNYQKNFEYVMIYGIDP